MNNVQQGALVWGILLGPIGAAVGAANGALADAHPSQQPANQPPTYPKPVDYSAAERHASDNNSEITQAQIASQEFALHQSTLDRETQHSADLLLGVEKLSTNLETSKLNYIQQMSAEENKHAEFMAGQKAKFGQLSSTSSVLSCEFPAPDTDE